jgi:protein-arginine kinase activator protein McsA
LAQLEAQKKAAIQNEDFDQAKALKMQIQQLRQSAFNPGATPTAPPYN